MKYVLFAASAMLLATACTSTGNVERNTAGGAAAGAVIGAIIGNNVGDGDAETGAVVGAVIGGAAGAARGSNQDALTCGRTERRRPYSQFGAGQPLQWDAQFSRRYYVDTASGRTYWENGEVRTC